MRPGSSSIESRDPPRHPPVHHRRRWATGMRRRCSGSLWGPNTASYLVKLPSPWSAPTRDIPGGTGSEVGRLRGMRVPSGSTSARPARPPREGIGSRQTTRINDAGTIHPNALPAGTPIRQHNGGIGRGCERGGPGWRVSGLVTSYDRALVTTDPRCVKSRGGTYPPQ